MIYEPDITEATIKSMSRHIMVSYTWVSDILLFYEKMPDTEKMMTGSTLQQTYRLYILHLEKVILNQLQSSWVMKNLLSQSHKWMIMVAIQAFQSRYWFIGVTSPKPINLATESVGYNIKLKELCKDILAINDAAERAVMDVTE